VRVANVLLLVAASCATGKSGSSGSSSEDGAATFKVFYPDQPVDGFKAKVGKKFIVKPVATCTYENGRDARWSMMSARPVADLPDGFTMEEGVIAVTPKAPGSWKIEVKFAGVVCAGKQEPEVVVPVMITAK
jgi:hypothetical protein